jgi:hypothetical protein
MSSAPSVPGVEVSASWLGGCGQVLTAVALELPAALHRMLGPTTVEIVEAGRHFADALAGSGRRVRHSTRTAALTR